MLRAAALHTYTQVALTARPPRALEAEAFAKALCLLKDAQRALPSFTPYADALRFNLSLWSIIQHDILAPDNPLPADLREKLLNLSVFVDGQTLKALGDPDGNQLRVLIDIDQQLLEGLLENPSAL